MTADNADHGAVHEHATVWRYGELVLGADDEFLMPAWAWSCDCGAHTAAYDSPVAATEGLREHLSPNDGSVSP